MNKITDIADFHKYKFLVQKYDLSSTLSVVSIFESNKISCFHFSTHNISFSGPPIFTQYEKIISHHYSSISDNRANWYGYNDKEDIIVDWFDVLVEGRKKDITH